MALAWSVPGLTSRPDARFACRSSRWTSESCPLFLYAIFWNRFFKVQIGCFGWYPGHPDMWINGLHFRLSYWAYINYDFVIVSNSCKVLYAPAINPFDVYNLLDKYIDKEIGANIAPLCTKPIALYQNDMFDELFDGNTEKLKNEFLHQLNGSQKKKK